MSNNKPLSLRSYPRAILHIDGDAFFASCEQGRNPALVGKPVITGKERGIASSMSYEAKARGVTRGMSLYEIKKVCPDAVILPSDYETYSLLSKRFYSIVRRYTPDVEEYGIDECFADITGLRAVHRMNYEKIAQMIKADLDRELGFTFSVGLAPTKVLAKVGSKWKKPSGFTAIPGYKIHEFLQDLKVEKIWGIGPQTTERLAKMNIATALELARKREEWIRYHFPKPLREIWYELNGKSIMELQLGEKTTYHSIQKMKTFTPASMDRKFVFSQLSKNIENACIKARRYSLSAKGVIIFLKQQDFRFHGIEVKFSRATSFPNQIISLIKKEFDKLFDPYVLYRSTGVVLFDLFEDTNSQMDIFGQYLEIDKLTRLFDSVDEVKKKYGKHTLFLGSSFYANKFGAHLGDRGDKPDRAMNLLKGETERKHLSIPIFLGEVS